MKQVRWQNCSISHNFFSQSVSCSMSTALLTGVRHSRLWCEPAKTSSRTWSCSQFIRLYPCWWPEFMERTSRVCLWLGFLHKKASHVLHCQSNTGRFPSQAQCKPKCILWLVGSSPLPFFQVTLDTRELLKYRHWAGATRNPLCPAGLHTHFSCPLTTFRPKQCCSRKLSLLSSSYCSPYSSTMCGDLLPSLCISFTL